MSRDDLDAPQRFLRKAMGAMKAVELARRSGVTPKHVSEVLQGKARISVDFALALEKVLNVPARTFIEIQARASLAKARLLSGERLAQRRRT